MTPVEVQIPMWPMKGNSHLRETITNKQTNLQSYHNHIEVLFKRAWLQTLRLDKPIQTHTQFWLVYYLLVISLKIKAIVWVLKQLRCDIQSFSKIYFRRTITLMTQNPQRLTLSISFNSWHVYHFVCFVSVIQISAYLYLYVQTSSV